MPFPLTQEQRAVVDGRGGALLVSAAAGSGKTRVLVERLLARVEDEGCGIDEFLVITFTNAAAAELRGRIAQELAVRLAGNPSNSHLRRQTTLVYKAKICTIDALCIDLLREHGHLLDLDPDFRICDQAEGDALALRVLDELLEERYREISPGFAALVEATVTGRDDVRLVNIVLDMHTRIQSHPNPARWLAERREAFRAEGISGAEETPWGALVLEHAQAQARHWRSEMAKALNLAAADPLTDANYGPTLSATLENLNRLAEAETWDQAAASFPVDFPRPGAKRGEDDPSIKEAVKGARARCKDAMDKLKELFEGDSAAVLSELRAVAPAMAALFDLVGDFETRFWEEKARRGLLEFADGEHLAARLLERAEVRALLRERFVEIMVDEYQDTNEVQNVLFEALSRDGQNLFLVGDVKQSIYRFRQADPTIFLDKYTRWPPAPQAQAGQPRKLLLSRNFRSRPQVLHGVNDVFETVMSRDCGELDYGPDEALYPPDGAPQDAPEYCLELNVLDLPEREGSVEEADKNLLEARFVARRMAQLLREGFPVDDGAGGTRPVRPEDMVILLRSPSPVLRHYARAMAEAGIPLEAEGGGDFFETTEVSVALSLLEIIDNPRQDVPLLSVLRSPVFGFSPDRLAALRAGCPDGDFCTALEADGGEDCRAVLEQLRLLRFRAGELPAHRLIERLYDETNLMAIFGAMPNGGERQANLSALREQARRFEGNGHKGLYSFLTHLGRLRQSGARVGPSAAGSGGVKLLSIHRSKGLEFPVVFLCGLGRQFNRMDASAPVLFHPALGVGPKRVERGVGWLVEYPTLARQAVALRMDRELKAEEMRLLYVAMTRAKEKLILTMSLGNAASALAKLVPDAARPAAPAAAAAVSNPGKWILLTALTRPEGEPLRTAAGGGIVYADGRGPAWDIFLRDAGELTQPLESHGEVAMPAVSAGEEQVEVLTAALAWTYPYIAAADLPSKLTATQLKGRALDAEAAEDTGTPPAPQHVPFARPDFAAKTLGLTAPQRGTALHKVLQYLDFSQTGSVEEITREIDRLVEGQFLTEQEGTSANPRKLADFFASKLGRALLAAPVREREYKFSLLLPGEEFFPDAEGEEVLFQGVVDCWFEDENGVTVVDFKTDRIPEPEQYRPQVEAYARALEELLGRPVAHRALYFFATGETVYL